jgi:hypothetical protein
MPATSEDLEKFHDRVIKIDEELTPLKGLEVKRSKTIEAIGQLAKDWIKYSSQLKEFGVTFATGLDPYDAIMSDLLQATKLRTRASSYRTKLKSFLDGFMDAIVVPLIKFEGSPLQIAERNLLQVFADSAEIEEYPYIEEAARCSSVKCHRAAIVMFWAAGMARMHASIQNKGFAAFNNAAATASGKKGRPYSGITKGLTIQSLAELQRTRDFDILTVGLELWSYDIQVYEELDRLLGTRNSAAHPGGFQPTALVFQQFATKIREYIFDKIR